MNLVLMNVDEAYTVMTRVPHPYTVMVHEPADPQPPPMSVSHPMAGVHSPPVLALHALGHYDATHHCCWYADCQNRTTNTELLRSVRS